MLQSISWGNYLEGAGLLLVCYYMLAGAAFYASDVKELFAGRRRVLKTTGPKHQDMTDGTATFDSLSNIVHEIDGILEQAGAGAAKEQLLAELKGKLAGYGGLERPAFRVALINHIISHTEAICGIRLSEQELTGQ